MYKSKPRGTGYIQQLADYVKKNISKGYTADSLRWALINQGHSKLEIDKAIILANEQLAAQAPKMVEKPMIKVEVEPPIVEKKGLWSKLKGLFSA